MTGHYQNLIPNPVAQTLPACMNATCNIRACMTNNARTCMIIDARACTTDIIRACMFIQACTLDQIAVSARDYPPKGAFLILSPVGSSYPYPCCLDIRTSTNPAGRTNSPIPNPNKKPPTTKRFSFAIRLVPIEKLLIDTTDFS